jgi:hypothetical protein
VNGRRRRTAWLFAGAKAQGAAGQVAAAHATLLCNTTGTRGCSAGQARLLFWRGPRQLRSAAGSLRHVLPVPLRRPSESRPTAPPAARAVPTGAEGPQRGRARFLPRPRRAFARSSRFLGRRASYLFSFLRPERRKREVPRLEERGSSAGRERFLGRMREVPRPEVREDPRQLLRAVATAWCPASAPSLPARAQIHPRATDRPARHATGAAFRARSGLGSSCSGGCRPLPAGRHFGPARWGGAACCPPPRLLTRAAPFQDRRHGAAASRGSVAAGSLDWPSHWLGTL